jgi:4-hydroxybenzoyl-CoA thioesterase
MHKSQLKVRVAWGDCDPAGIVFFPQYFAFCNEGTGALFESVGFPKPLLLKTYEIVGYPVVEVSGSFFRPCTFGDDLVIESSIAEWGRASFRLLHRILKGGELAVEVREKRVWTARNPDKPEAIVSKPIPDELKARFAG